MGISTEQSELTSKEFQLVYDDPDFTVMPPKLDTWMIQRCTEYALSNGVRYSVQALLKPWGRSFTHFFRKRHESVLKLTESRVDYLLKTDSYVETGKKGNVLSSPVIFKMLKEANQDETLSRCDKAV